MKYGWCDAQDLTDIATRSYMIPTLPVNHDTHSPCNGQGESSDALSDAENRTR